MPKNKRRTLIVKEWDLKIKELCGMYSIIEVCDNTDNYNKWFNDFVKLEKEDLKFRITFETVLVNVHKA